MKRTTAKATAIDRNPPLEVTVPAAPRNACGLTCPLLGRALTLPVGVPGLVPFATGKSSEFGFKAGELGLPDTGVAAGLEPVTRCVCVRGCGTSVKVLYSTFLADSLPAGAAGACSAGEFGDEDDPDDDWELEPATEDCEVEEPGVSAAW